MIVHPDLLRHPRFKRLERMLGIGAMRYLIGLWVLAQMESPDLSGWSDGDIEISLDWDGDDGFLCAAFRACGWLTTENIVDRWEKHNAKLIAVRENGRRGGRPAKPTGNQTETKTKPTETYRKPNGNLLEPTHNLRESDRDTDRDLDLDRDIDLENRQTETEGESEGESLSACLSDILVWLSNIGFDDYGTDRRRQWCKQHHRRLIQIMPYWSDIVEANGIESQPGALVRMIDNPEMGDTFLRNGRRLAHTAPKRLHVVG